MWRPVLLMSLVFLFVATQCLAGGSPSHKDAVVKQIAALAQDKVGFAGVAASVIGENDIVEFHADTSFPMASTYKVAIAMAVLDRVDRRLLTLDKMVTVPADLVVYSAPIAENFIHPGLTMSVANLVEIMIVSSDNTATDVLLNLLGGPGAVNDYVRALGIQGIRVDRSTAQILTDFYELDAVGLDKLQNAVRFVREQPERLIAPKQSFEDDPRDQATPAAMLELLLKLAERDALSPGSSDFLLASMQRTRTVPQRIPGRLPEGTPTARKSGTIGGVANDVGYVSLPDGRRMALVVFTKGSATTPANRDRAVAEISRTIYDYFVLSQPR